MTQATAELNETATDAQPDEQFELDVLSSFADDDQAVPPTTSLEGGAETSAKPDTDDSSSLDTETTATPEYQENAVATLESALAELKELRETSKKSADGLGGRLGSIEQAIKTLQAATGKARTKVRGSIERFGEFGKEYPDFAKAQVDFVNGLFEELDLPALSPEFTTNLIRETQTTAEKTAEQRYARQRTVDCREDLSETHPDWIQTIGLPDKDVEAGGVVPDTEFRRWLKTQPDGYGERVLGSYSSVVIGRALDKFADSKKKAQRPQTLSAVPSTRQQQLRAAVAPRTSGSAPTQKKELTGREAMLAEFDSN